MHANVKDTSWLSVGQTWNKQISTVL